jgi:hypothetical protein
VLAHSCWLTLSLSAAVLAAAERSPMLPLTTLPIIYSLDYTDRYFTKPEFLDQFKLAPPDLLHWGKALPITHLWGPVPLYAGENQYTGGPKHTLNWKNIALLSPEAVAQRTEHIRNTLARYHAASVREIVPYISYHTIAGDHQKRLGFWAFYDQWEKYEKWAGPKPAHDPLDWLVVDKKGRFLPGSCGGYTPDYFKPLHRYRACINHPDWAAWHRRLIGMAADVGYDGCFVDNADPDPCFCRYCKKAFRDWLAADHDEAWVHQLTQGLVRSELTLDGKQTPAELVRRWRVIATSEYIGKLRQAAGEVKPGFTVFPNSSPFQECLIVGGQCDRLMAECTSSPGLRSAGRPPETDQIVVRVAAKPTRSDRYKYQYHLSDPIPHATVNAEITLPIEAQIGKAAEITVRVVQVGDWPTDNDFAEDFVIVLRDSQTSEETLLPLAPAVTIGGSGAPRKVEKPPVSLKAAWTPRRSGDYAIQFGFRYTDEGHGPKSIRFPCLGPLSTGQLCVDHLAELLFAQHMHARTIYQGYEFADKEWENVQELSLAEMAAFSGGGGVSRVGRPQAKYRAFFKQYPDLFAGWRTVAPAAVLYSYWGPNPLSPQFGTTSVIHNHLASGHRPFVALVDARLPEDAAQLAAFSVLYLESPCYEMSAEQLESLRQYAKDKQVVLADKDVAINGQSAVGLLQDGRVAIWDPKNPAMPTPAIAPTDGLRKNVRFAIYQKSNQLVVHAVNYNVCLLDAKKQILDVEPMPLSMPVPADWRSARATCFDPDGAVEIVSSTVSDGMARLTLPKLHIYKILLLEHCGAKDMVGAGSTAHEIK